MIDYMNTAHYRLSRFEAAMSEISSERNAATAKAVGISGTFVEDLRADLADLRIQWNIVYSTAPQHASRKTVGAYKGKEIEAER
jgi:hypothetical protein